MKYWLPYVNLYVFTKSADESIYEDMRSFFPPKFINILIFSEFYDNCEDTIVVDDYSPGSFVVFDDCITENQQKIKDYFVRSRPKNILCILSHLVF